MKCFSGRSAQMADRLRCLVAALVLAATFGLAGSGAAFAQAGPLGNPPERSVKPRCPIGSVFAGGECVRPKTGPQCPPGTAGQHPNCRPVVRSLCPRGTTGIYPNCRPTIKRPPPMEEPGLQPRQPPEPRILDLS